jgi:hypothetical protein
MPQDILVAEYHGTFHDTSSIKLLLGLQNKLDIKEKGQSRWSHQFMFANKSVPHLPSQCALARMAKTLSFHTSLFWFSTCGVIKKIIVYPFFSCFTDSTMLHIFDLGLTGEDERNPDMIIEGLEGKKYLRLGLCR